MRVVGRALLAFVVACSSPSVAKKPASVEPTRPIADDVAPPDAGTQDPPPPEIATSVDAGVTDAGTSTEGSRHELMSEEAVRELLRANGVASTPELENRLFGCSIVSVGAPRRPGVWCTNKGPMVGSADTGESLFPLTVWAVAKHSMQVVLEVPIAAGPMDMEARPSASDPNEGNYIKLAATLSDDGLRITVAEQDHPDAKCAAVLGRPVEKDLVPVVAKSRSMVKKACASIGRYVWRDGRFSR